MIRKTFVFFALVLGLIFLAIPALAVPLTAEWTQNTDPPDNDDLEGWALWYSPDQTNWEQFNVIPWDGIAKSIYSHQFEFPHSEGTWHFRMRAYDEVPNFSDWSNVAIIDLGGDVTPPSPPGGFTITAQGDGPMAFPQVASVNGGNTDANQTDHTVPLPSGIQSGDLLLVFFGCDSDGVISWPGDPGDWNELFQTNVNGSSGATLAVAYRIADGTEGESITVTLDSAERAAYTSYRITGYSGTPESSNTTGTDEYPDPPNLSPTWGAKDTLWFVGMGMDNGLREVTIYPTNYTDGRNDRAAASTGVSVGTARRELNASSENPGVFTTSASENWVACTVAVQPTGVGDLSINISETLSLSESIGRSLPLGPINISDSISISELTQVFFDWILANTSETISISELTQALMKISPSTSETISISEALTILMKIIAQVSDSISITESIQAAINILSQVTDTISITDIASASVAALGDLEASLSDSISISEAIVTILEGPKVSTSEIISIGELLTIWKDVMPSVSDSVSISEVIEILMKIIASTSESLTISDIATVAISGDLNISTTDALTITEQVLVKFNLWNVVASDIVSIVEDIILFMGIKGTVTESVSITDVATAAISGVWNNITLQGVDAISGDFVCIIGKYKTT